MNIQIIVKDILYPTLEFIADKEGLTPEQYAANIVESFVERQYRASVMDKIKESTVEEIAVIKDNNLADLQSSVIIKLK